jgi:hypothetical protein
MQNTFGRLGDTKTVNAQAAAVRAAGGTVKRDRDAGTVIAKIGESIAFRALSKGGGIWIVIYSREFYGN